MERSALDEERHFAALKIQTRVRMMLAKAVLAITRENVDEQKTLLKSHQVSAILPGLRYSSVPRTRVWALCDRDGSTQA